MYSDRWLFDKTLHKTSAVWINEIVNIEYWKNERNRLVGVCINYEEVDDVHYELMTDGWKQFLKKVLKVRVPRFGMKRIRAFFETKGYFTFEAALKAENIKYQKAAFYG